MKANKLVMELSSENKDRGSKVKGRFTFHCKSFGTICISDHIPAFSIYMEGREKEALRLRCFWQATSPMPHSRYAKPSPLPSNSISHPCCLPPEHRQPQHHQAKDLVFHFREKGNCLYFLIHSHKFISGYIHGHILPSEETGHFRQICIPDAIFHLCRGAYSLCHSSLHFHKLARNWSLLPPALYIHMLKSLSYIKKYFMFSSM